MSFGRLKGNARLMRILERLSRLSRARILALGLALNFVLAAIEFLSGPLISFSIFYLVPIALVSWCATRRLGFLMSVICADTWLVFDVTLGTGPAFVPYWNAFVRLGFFITVSFLLSSLKDALERQKELARTDHLTGVANSRYFYEQARREIDRGHRYGRPLSVLFMDLDNFKIVNDRFGHQTGDELLAVVTDIMKRFIRKTDVVARLGGDEFAVLLPETGQKSAAAVTHKVQEELLCAMQDRGWPVTVSIGLVTFLTPPESVDEMLEKADQLMYAAKTSGKNTVKHMTFSGPVPAVLDRRPMPEPRP
jgi:diguanylate cyclase (GGDEF)-like protein